VVSLGKKTQYFSPGIDFSGSRLVCIQIDLLNNYFLVIIDLPSGNIIERIPVSGFLEISDPV
jgi:hypothetical protein